MSQLMEKVWDWIFPPFCVSCNRPGSWWCEECRGKVEKIQGRICPACLSLENHECTGDLPFKQVWSFGMYHDPVLRAVITKIKFNGVTILKDDLIVFLSTIPGLVLPQDAVIVPMPLSDKRLKERGFNQAEYMASIMKQVYLWPNQIDLNVIKRVKHRDPQSGMGHEYDVRAGNISGVFECTKEPPRSVILIDDVATTGATAAEAARVLMQAGTEEVYLVTLAIGA